MKCYYFGTPHFGLVKWAFKLKQRWKWSRFLTAPIVFLMIVFLGLLAWLLVKAGCLGHQIASGLGVDSREHWE